MPYAVTGDTGEVEFERRENSSEKLVMTSRTKEQIQENLRELDPQQWQVLTKLPSPIFRYNLSLINYLAVPKNSKIESFFLVTLASDDTQRVMPGQEIALRHNLQIEDISSTLASTNVDLVYGAGDFGMYWNLYDKKGKFISQATGTIVIKPTFWTRVSIFVGVWIFLLGLVALLKKTLLVSKDFEEIKVHYKRQK